MGLMPGHRHHSSVHQRSGSSVVTNMIALGLVLNVCIRSKVINF